MKLDDVLALCRAGYTAAQIAQFSELEDASHPGQPEQPTQPAQPEQPAQPAQPEQPAQPAQPAQPDPMSAIMEQLGLIRDQIQSVNRSGAQQPPSQEIPADQVLANVIRPARPKKEV